ncbi:MAG: glycosyltransferase family 25 protein [Gammaproteobacteria bacterium]|nr:glycosyltransferase family 25 protein [Gammaproteobacteria bacterium]
MAPKIYLINLDDSVERLNKCQALFDANGLELERVAGVLGKALSIEEVAKYYDEAANSEVHYRTLSLGEIGCYLSHRKCWQKIVDSGEPFGVVVEDDINITGDVSAAIEAIQHIEFEWDLIKLAAYKRKTRPVKFSHRLNSNFSLVIHDKPMSGCAATAYSREGAIKLLEATKRFARAVDTDIQYFWEKNIEVLSLAPYVFEQNLDEESTLSAGRAKNKRRPWRRKFRQVKDFFKNRSEVAKQVKAFQQKNS